MQLSLGKAKQHETVKDIPNLGLSGTQVHHDDEVLTSRKVTVSYGQIVFLTLMNDSFVKWNRGENGKYNDMMRIVFIEQCLYIIHCSNHFAFNSSFAQHP